MLKETERKDYKLQKHRCASSCKRTNQQQNEGVDRFRLERRAPLCVLAVANPACRVIGTGTIRR